MRAWFMDCAFPEDRVRFTKGPTPGSCAVYGLRLKSKDLFHGLVVCFHFGDQFVLYLYKVIELLRHTLAVRCLQRLLHVPYDERTVEIALDLLTIDTFDRWLRGIFS